MVILSLFSDILYVDLKKTLIIISLTTNIHIPYGCDPLDLYILLVNNFIDPITPCFLIFINYLNQYRD